MGFFKLLETEFNELCKTFIDRNINTNSSAKSSSVDLDELLKNAVISPQAKEETPKQNYSSSTLEPEVQNAINKYNNLSANEREKILEKVDKVLQEKLMNFMDCNASFSDTVEKRAFSLRSIENCINNLKENNDFSNESLEAIMDSLQEAVILCCADADSVIKIFNDFKGDSMKLSNDNKDEYAINKSCHLKQAINAYCKLFTSKMQEIYRAPLSQKLNLIIELSEIIDDIQNEYNNFQSYSKEMMNAFIPEAISMENRYSASMQKYLKGVPSDLNLGHKVVENTLIDIILKEAGFLRPANNLI